MSGTERFGERTIKSLARKAHRIDPTKTAWAVAGWHYGEYGSREAARRLRAIIAQSAVKS